MTNTSAATKQDLSPHKFSGNIFIYHSFDVGEDISLERLKTAPQVITRPLQLPKYFKNYHTPLDIDLPHPHSSTHNTHVRLYGFGCASLSYCIPFEATLQELAQEIESTENQIREQSFEDANAVFKTIKEAIYRPYFFHTHASYLIIQLDHIEGLPGNMLKKLYGAQIASLLRFERQVLSDFQKSEILEASIGYFKGDLIVVDAESAFVYDPEYDEILTMFEFANVQQLELRYFDRILDQQLNMIYEERERPLPINRYLPFFGIGEDPVDKLGKLKVDISVITERLESSIKLAGEPFYSDLYALIEERLGLDHWRAAVEKKLAIVSDIRSDMQHKIDSVREDLLTVLIIILILIELIVAIIK